MDVVNFVIEVFARPKSVGMIKNTFGTDLLLITSGKESTTVSVAKGEAFTVSLAAKTKITAFCG